MKKNLLKITFASLLALSLTACSCSGNGGNGGNSDSGGSGTSTSSTTSVPPHVHQYDEHGVCSCGAYRGDTKDATKEDPYVLKNIVAGTEYFFRLKAAKNIQTVLTCNDNPKADATKTKLWETDGTIWNEIPVYAKTHIISNASDGYYYVRYVSTEDIAQINWFVENHVHQAMDDQGFCWCDAYMGSPLQVNQELTINPTVAGQTYYARIRNLNPAEKYQLIVETETADAGAVYGAWGTDNETSFTGIDLFDPSGAVNYNHVYLAFRPSIAGYSITFKLVVTHRPDDAGYCAADGEFIGEELTNSTLLNLYTLEQGTHYFRVEVAKDDLVMFTMGNGFVEGDNGETTFYSRSVDGQTITELGHSPEIAFIAPALPDGYLYIKVGAYDTVTVPFLGLVDMNAGYGYVGTVFTGLTLNPGRTAISPVGIDEALFFRFETHASHFYQIADRGGYDTDGVTWYGHDKTTDDFHEIGNPTQITMDSEGHVTGKDYICDFVVVKFMPADESTPHAHGGTEIRFVISHGETNLDDMWVCTVDGLFDGTEVSTGQAVDYSIFDDRWYYRFPIANSDTVVYSFDLTNGGDISHLAFYTCTDAHVYDNFLWSPGEPRTDLESVDGYIYILINAEGAMESFTGTFTIHEAPAE